MRDEVIHRLGRWDCSQCTQDQQDACGEREELCPDMERRVDRDTVKRWDHLLLGDDIENMSDENIVIYASDIYLTPREKQIVTLLDYGLSRREVCKALKITRETLRINIHRMKLKALHNPV